MASMSLSNNGDVPLSLFNPLMPSFNEAIALIANSAPCSILLKSGTQIFSAKLLITSPMAVTSSLLDFLKSLNFCIAGCKPLAIPSPSGKNILFVANDFKLVSILPRLFDSFSIVPS